MVRDYDIGQVWDILSELDRSVDEAKIRESKHVRRSFDLRSDDFNREMVYGSLIEKKPVLIGKSNYNSFKVVYEHPTKSSQDLYVIISLDDNGNILIVTVYNHSKARRIRHHESP